MEKSQTDRIKNHVWKKWKFPLLFSMAIVIFYTRNVSEAKWDFSEAKHTITGGRLSLHIDAIEAMECLKSWLRAEIFT